MPPMTDTLPGAVSRSLLEMGFRSPGGGGFQAEALTGGVASDIWRVETDKGPVCVKSARARLKVAQRWEVPVIRNAYEVDWFRTAATVAPDAVPRILGHDPGRGLFVMEYLDPARYRVWKALLRDGEVDPSVALAVARILVSIHRGTAGDPEVAGRFQTDDLFFAIRPEPYLLATATRNPDVAERLHELADTTMRNKKALVHGDISPKNILVGPRGPVILDAECAWYGDPAFDLAFCLNHLLLKCLWRPAAMAEYLHCFDAMAAAYVRDVDWEPAVAIEARTAHLLPGLLLGRIDGKSPVEYITDDVQRGLVRSVARPLLLAPCNRLDDVRNAWVAALGR